MAAFADEELDFASLVREGARILIGQGTAEPRTLTQALVRQADRLPPCRIFIGPTFSDTFSAMVPERVHYEGYGAIGNAAKLASSGKMDVFPDHFSSLALAFRTGQLHTDIVLLQLRPSLKGFGYNLGLARDFVIEAARHARYVIAEINPSLPACCGGEVDTELNITHLVEAEHPPLEIPPPVFGETEKQIAANVAALIPDGAVIQVGIGAIPAAVLYALAGHENLGFHSGAASDGLVDLVEAGVMTNALKEVDAGVSVTGILLGSRKLYEFAHRNPHLRLAPPDQTHGQSYIGRLSRFHAINSALEVDITGQVGAEEAHGRQIGAIGGQVDYVRAARHSHRGRSIIALPSMTREGKSRIVAHIDCVTCARSDVDTIVTEYGVAELRGQNLSERARRMIEIAAPQWREDLERSFFIRKNMP